MLSWMLGVPANITQEDLVKSVGDVVRPEEPVLIFEESDLPPSSKEHSKTPGYVPKFGCWSSVTFKRLASQMTRPKSVL